MYLNSFTRSLMPMPLNQGNPLASLPGMVHMKWTVRTRRENKAASLIGRPLSHKSESAGLGEGANDVERIEDVVQRFKVAVRLDLHFNQD
jgi:hypothetical protein